jgi:CheY-like chemotaxis protein
MPGLSGSDILDELKSDPSTSTVPVVIITSKRLSESEREELSVRADAIMGKSELGDTSARSILAELLNTSPTSGPLGQLKTP